MIVFITLFAVAVHVCLRLNRHGFTLADIASMKGISERTVQRQWDKARMFLHRALA